MKELTKELQAELNKHLSEDTPEELTKHVSENLREYNIKPANLGRIFEVLSEPECGIGKELIIDDLVKNVHPEYRTKNGGDWCRDHTSYIGRKYQLERNHRGNRIYSVKLNGTNREETKHARSISPEIQKALKDQRCAVLDINATKMEIDHKNGRYDDRKNESNTTQTIDDFQRLSKAANDAKREHCKKCHKTGKRYDAKNLGYSESFWLGDENTKVCEGCYWYDPKKFNSKISKDFKKTK